ncbi:MAG: ABC transporter permease, partial [Bacteroidota bacterium]
IFVGIYLTKFILSRITEFVFSLSNKFLSAIGSNFISMNEIPKFDFYISNQNIILSFCIGIFISLIIIFFYSKKISKLGIVNAIRGIDTYSAMQHHKHISLRILLIFLSILIVIKGVESSDFVLSSFGLIISFIGLTLKKIGKSKLLFNLIITLLLVFTIFIKVDVFKSGENALIMVFLKPMILLISLPILLLKNLDVIKSLFLKWPFLKIVDPFITKIAFAYPKSEKSKTRLIVTMYSLVLFIIVIVTVIPHSQMIGIRKSGNTLFWGYEAFIPDFLNSNDNYEKDLKESGLIKDIQPIKAFNINSVKGNQRAFLIDSDFQFHNPTGKWYPTSNYDTISDAIKHLKENKNAYLVISGRENATSNSGSKNILLPGDPSLKLGTYFFDNITFFQGFVLSNENKLKTNDYSRYDLIKIAGNTHEEQTENKKAFRNYIERNGIFAITNDDVVEISELGIQGMIKILNGFLYFGMIIGIMGISITMYRAFYDRKKTIGMLKAIGFTKSQIFFSFLIETSIIVITGLLIGIVSGIISGQQINSIFSQLGAPGGKTLYIPWIDLIIVSLSFYIASIISVLIPSYNASKIKPAEALKTIE